MAKSSATYRVAIKPRIKSPRSWKWEIYREGQSFPVRRSGISYSSPTRALRNGRDGSTLGFVTAWLALAFIAFAVILVALLSG